MTTRTRDCPPLIVSLIKMRRVLNEASEKLDWDNPFLDCIAELQTYLSEAFVGAKRLILP